MEIGVLRIVNRWNLTAAVACFLLVCSRDTLAQTLMWNAPAGSTVSGFIYSYGTQSGVYTRSVDVGNVTSAQLSGLASSTTYTSSSSRMTRQACEVFRQRRSHI